MDIISIDRDLRLCPVPVLALAYLLPLVCSLAFFSRNLGQHFRVEFFPYKTLLQKPSRRWPFNNDEALQGSTLPWLLQSSLLFSGNPKLEVSYVLVEPSIECLERSSSNLFFCWLQDFEKL